MNKRHLARTAAICTVCAALGASAGISNSFAKTHPNKKAEAAYPSGTDTDGDDDDAPPAGGPGQQAVHSVDEVLNAAGTAYVEQTADDGIIKAIDGDTLTIHEGNKSVTYQNASLTISDDADVTLNGKDSTLSKLAVGEHVRVTSSSDGTEVHADNGRPPRPPRRGPGRPPRPGAPKGDAHPGGSDDDGDDGGTSTVTPS